MIQLAITSIAEKYELGKARAVMMLGYSKEQSIRENPPKVRTGRKWTAEKAVNRMIRKLKHADIVGATQEARAGLWLHNFRPFCKSSIKEMKEAVVHEGKRV